MVFVRDWGGVVRPPPPPSSPFPRMHAVFVCIFTGMCLRCPSHPHPTPKYTHHVNASIPCPRTCCAGSVGLVLTEVDPTTGVAVHSPISPSDLPGFVGALSCPRSAPTDATTSAGGVAVDATLSLCQVTMMQVSLAPLRSVVARWLSWCALGASSILCATTFVHPAVSHLRPLTQSLCSSVCHQPGGAWGY
jgi:hypothetical protein